MDNNRQLTELEKETFQSLFDEITETNQNDSPELSYLKTKVVVQQMKELINNTTTHSKNSRTCTDDMQ